VRPYAKVLAFQSLDALAGSASGPFIVFYYLDDGGSPLAPLAFFLVGFAAAAIGVAGMTRLRADSHRTMAAGVALFALAFPLLLLLPDAVSPYVASVPWGLSIPAFFLPLNTLAARTTQRGDRAVKLGGLFLGFAVVGIFGPSLGGVLVWVGGYALCFTFAVVLLAADAVLILSQAGDASPLAFRIALPRLGRRLSAGLLGEGGVEGVLTFLGAVTVFGFLQGPRELGLLLSLFALAGGVMSVLLGRLSDRIRHRRRFIVAGAMAAGAALAALAFTATLSYYVVVNSLVVLTATVAPLFLFAAAVDRFEEAEGEAVATREVLLNAGRALGLVAMGVLLLLGLPTVLGFGLAAVFALGMALG